ncbi:MAG: aquaporin family protein [Alphaproteobacteria bacterium]|nr:aquaporin family protein [Alphaproteobacteria bacterium]
MDSQSAPTLTQKLAAEFLGTGLLLTAIVGSGIMAVNLASGNVALSLLANAIATGAALVVLIVIFAPVSGAHLNPAVSLAFRLQGELSTPDTVAYCVVQIVAGCLGVLLAHAMFDQQLWQSATEVRTGASQWLSEAVAAFGLILTILLTRRARPDLVAVTVGLYITSAYWFTASTSFANPAVTIARSLTNTFTGIRAEDVPLFLSAQIIGAVAAWLVACGLEVRSHGD